MSKKNKSMKKTVVKIIAVVCIIGLSFGVGISQIGIEQLLEAQTVEEIFTVAHDIYIQMSSGENENLIGTNYSDARYEIAQTTGELEVYVFDVGQADCTLIGSSGEFMLIDAGNNADGKYIVNQLQSMGIDDINYLIGTHPHEDHIGGLDDVIKNFNVRNLYMPDMKYDSSTYRNVISAADKKKLEVVEPKVGHKFTVGEAICEVMCVDGDADDANHASIVIEVTHGANKLLFMGDAEIVNEETRLWNDVAVLKVGHHGSSTSSSDDFLEQVAPEIAIISCGTGNSYGHPHRETMTALKGMNLEILRTDTQGTIHVISDGKSCKTAVVDIDLDGEE